MPYRILLVDDNETILRWAEGILRKAGYETVARSQPIGTTAAIVRENPDLVLLDVNMPGLEGDDVVSSLRRSAKGSTIRVVLCSSLPAHELRAKAEACGADGFLCKTSDKDEYVRQVTQFLRKPTATRGKVMVIVDSEFQGALSEMALSRFPDLEMVKCSDDTSAMQQWHTRHFVLLIVFAYDVPEPNQYQTLVAARRASTPVIFVAGNTTDGASNERAKELGIGQLLSDPVTPGTLAEAIQNVRR